MKFSARMTPTSAVPLSPERTAIRVALAQERAEADADYINLAAAIADGQRPDDDYCLDVIHAAGKTLDDFAKDVAAIGIAMGGRQLRELFFQVRMQQIFDKA